MEMLIAIAITATITCALGYSLHGGREGPLISRHGYNNRYSDASASRQDHLG
jgi:hypothetical protein